MKIKLNFTRVLLGNNEIFKPDVLCAYNICSNLDSNSDMFITFLARLFC
jgi:hypothetical protein